MMKRLVKTEFYKLCKSDHILLIALLLLYPVMWSILACRNEIVLVENGHSMLSWVLIQLFSMEKSFILTLVFAMIVNTIVGDERRKGYLSMIQNKGILPEQFYLSKAFASMGYLFLIFLSVIVGTAVCYWVFVSNNNIMATGKLWNTGELIPGMEILLIWILDKCILFPSMFIWLSKRRSTVKTVVFLIIFNFLDRGIAMPQGISFLSIWSNYKNADHFVSLCRDGNLNIHLSIIVQILMYSGILLILIKKRKMRKKDEHKIKGRIV